jgi:hypothetical protein
MKLNLTPAMSRPWRPDQRSWNPLKPSPLKRPQRHRAGDRKPAERAVAFAALSRAAAGAPFPVAFADLQRLWPQAPGLSALAGPARTGAPTLDQLKRVFPATASAP